MGLILELFIVWGFGYVSNLLHEVIVGDFDDACDTDTKGSSGGDNSFGDAIFWSDVGNS